MWLNCTVDNWGREEQLLNTSNIGSLANVLRGSSRVPAPRGELHDEPKERLAGEATSNKAIVIKE